jgi:HK97 family phage portal protein
MGLGAAFTRSSVTTYTASQVDTISGNSTVETFSIVDLTPSWNASGHYRGGMGIPAAYRAATLIADLVGGLEWDGYRDDPEGDLAKRITPRPGVLDRPAPPRPRITTVSSMVLDYLWHGNAIALKVGYDASGNTAVILPVRASSVWVRQVLPNDDIPFPVGSFAYAISLLPGYPQLWYGQDEVIHIMGPAEPWAVRGMGILENHLSTLNLAHEQVRQATQATGSGIPTGVLTSDNPDLEQSEADEISAAWMVKQRDRKVAVLNATTHYEALAWNPTEAQLVEARELSMHEIALMFGLDPSWLGKSRSSMSYSNVEQEAVNLLKFGSPGGVVARFEAAFSDLLAAGSRAKANLDALLRADTLARYQAHALAFGKWLTTDEIRAIEDRAPLTPAERAELTAMTTPPGPDPKQLHSGQGAPKGAGAPDTGAPAAQRALDEAAEIDADLDELQRANPLGSGATLRKYWTKGKGLAKWASNPHPFTTLVAHLGKYVENPEGLAAEYYHDVFHKWPGGKRK